MKTYLIKNIKAEEEKTNHIFIAFDVLLCVFVLSCVMLFSVKSPKAEKENITAVSAFNDSVIAEIIGFSESDYDFSKCDKKIERRERMKKGYIESEGKTDIFKEIYLELSGEEG